MKTTHLSGMRRRRRVRFAEPTSAAATEPLELSIQMQSKNQQKRQSFGFERENE